MSHNINDVLYGSIFLEDLELEIIDHKLFQRLRDISQLGFLSYAFPSANHTRFEHSIGVMDLCSKMYDRLLANQENLVNKNPVFESSRYEQGVEALKADGVKKRLRLAALLHDVGHGPYSHSSEMFTANISGEDILSLSIPSFLKEVFERRLSKGETPHHEWMTAVISVYIFESLEHLEDRELLQDVLSLLSKDILPSKGSPLSHQNIFQLLREIISGEIDGDRMDYLYRDSYYTGAKYGIFDLNRILSSLYFSIDTEDIPHLALGEGGLFTFEDFLFSRYQMYVQIYLHRTSMGLELVLGKIAASLEKIAYPLDQDNWLNFNDHSFEKWLEDEVKRSNVFEVFKEKLEWIFRRKPLKMIYDATLQDSNEEDFEEQKRKYEDIFKEDFRHCFYFYEKCQNLSKFRPSTTVNLKFLKHGVAGYDFRSVQDKPYFENSFSKSLEIRRIFVEKQFYEKEKSRIEKLKNAD